MQALCAWRLFVRELAACGAEGPGGQPLLARVAQQAVVVVMEALEEGGQVSAHQMGAEVCGQLLKRVVG